MSFQDFQKMLAALRAEAQSAQAPPRVEAALRAAFRAQVKRRRRPQWIGWALGAAATIVAAVGVGATWIPKEVPSPPLPPAPIAKAPDPLPQPQPQFVARRAVRRAPAPEAAARAPQEEVTTQFLPLDDTLHLAPLESGQVLRVQVPRATLVRFGLPVNQERMTERIPADVVFGQDGIARAIRFVK
jgi:hypothetical protein